jgi:large subunit ribosomal protein L25
MVIALKAQARTAGDDLKKLRASGRVPAVVYGSGRETMAISVAGNEFQKVWKQAGESGTVTIELPSGKETVLIQEMTLDPMKNIPQHVDFRVIDVSKPITVTIPLEFIGVAPAVKNGLGVLVKVVHEIEVTGLPKDIPHNLEVDISGLETLDHQVAISDLKLPVGVTATAEETDMVASIAPIVEETEEPAVIDFSAIEVEKKGKKEDEDAAA